MRGSWFTRLKKAGFMKGTSQRKSRRPSSFRPRLEMLERRLYLSATYIVNTTTDLAAVTPHELSLRQAVAEANAYSPGGATVLLAATGTYKLTDGEVDITNNMTIAGLAPSISVIDGQLADRIFDINGGLNVTIKSLTLQNGSTTAGGAIYMNSGTGGALNLTNMVIKNNSALLGGGVFVGDGNSLTLNSDTFSGNLAASGGGGAVAYYGSSLTINSSTFTSNGSGSDGGAVYYNTDDTGALTLSVAYSTFTNNVCVASGGGIYVDTEVERIHAPQVFTTTEVTTSGLAFTVTHSTFTGNTDDGDGGAIALANGNAQAVVSFSHSNFTRNTADNDGGGAYLDDIESLTVTGCNFTGNRSTDADGGGIYARVNSGGFTSISGSSFTGNSAYSSGGGVYTDATSTLTVTQSTFTGNTAYNDAGGGLFAIGDDEGSASITNSTFSGNKAHYTGGGAVLHEYEGLTICSSTFTSNTSQSQNTDEDYFGGGGGFLATGDDDGTASITNSTFTGNSAYGSGGGAYLEEYTGLTITGSTFKSNMSLDGAGGGIYVNYEAAKVELADASLVAPVSSGTASICNTTFTGNSAYESGGGAYIDNFPSVTIGGSYFQYNTAAGTGGGGIFALGSAGASASITKSTFTCNVSEASAGGAYLGDFASVNVQNNTISKNTSRNSGGGMYVSNDTSGSTLSFMLENNTISYNTTEDGEGGGVYYAADASSAAADTVTISGNTITHNVSGGDGGGLLLYAESAVTLGATISLNTFSNNTLGNPNGGGGGLFVEADNATGVNSLAFSQNTVAGNTVGGNGGGLYLDVNFTNSGDNTGTPGAMITANTFSGNTAAVSGGGLFLETFNTGTTGGAYVKLINDTISGNSARFGDGGGVYADAAAADTIKLVDDTIALNHALLGGGVYVVPGGGVTTVVDTIIATNMASSQADGYDVIGTFTDEGYNLIGIAGPESPGVGVTTDLLGKNPKLGSLAYYGGPTQTMILLGGSPAIGTGTASLLVDADIPSVDQRGVARAHTPNTGAY